MHLTFIAFIDRAVVVDVIILDLAEVLSACAGSTMRFSLSHSVIGQLLQLRVKSGTQQTINQQHV